MRRSKNVSLILPAIALVATALACALPGQGQTVDLGLSQTQTINAFDLMMEATRAAASGGEAPGETPAPSPEQPAEPAAPTPTPTVVHQITPSSPGSVQSYMTDISSASTAGERRSTGDNFSVNRMERPFTSEVMDYQPYLDITRGELSASSPWLYIVIYLEEAPPAEAEATYGVEIDLNLDGRGDWLIMGALPPSSDWTTNGVRAFRDSNGDVGGAHPMESEEPPQSGNGFDTLVFDQGFGADPDIAWIRRSPSASDQIQIAFKYSLIGLDGEFLWGVWADGGLNEPGWFDYNDHFSIAEAGSPLGGNTYYPVRALASIDNSCRWTYDFTPVEQLPGMCILPPTPTPIVPGAIRGVVWRDNNWNGVRGPGDSLLAGVTVTLRSGGCGGSVVSTTATNASGQYSFTNLTPGDYCVSVSVAAEPNASCGCGDYCLVAGNFNPTSVTVPSGGDVVVDFGFFQQGPC